MLHIILFILKILGCILLALLGLILVLLLIVLFVPIRYDVSGSYYGSPDFAARITWLFGIIKANAEFKNKKFRINIKVLWKSLFDTNKKENSNKDIQDNDISPGDSDDMMLEDGDCVIPEISDKHISADCIEVSSEDKNTESTDNTIKTANTDNSKKLKENPLKTPKPSVKKKINPTKKEKIKKDKVSFEEKITCAIEKLINKIDTVADNIDEKADILSSKWSKIERFLYAECTQNSLKLIRRMLLAIFKHILPDKVKGKVHFGFDRSSQTGKILGYASAFYPLYNNSIQIIPDFEQKIFEGELDFQGSIQIYIFVLWLLRAAICKDIRKLIKYIKHLKG